MPEEIEETKELKEFLTRGEIQTMAKDVAGLREIEAQKERERITALKPEETPKDPDKSGPTGQVKKEVILPSPPAAPPSPPLPERKEGAEKEALVPKVPTFSFIPQPPKKPPSYQKILVRAGVVVIVMMIFFSLGFVFWYFGIKPSEAPPKGEKPSVEEGVLPEEKIIVPPALISIVATETLAVLDSNEIPSALSKLLEKKIEKEGFVRILIKNTKENKLLGLKEFFAALKVKTPEGFWNKLNNDFTLFIYSEKGINRLGFITKILNQKEELTKLLKSWEPTMEKDTEPLFLALGKKGPSLVPYFRQTNFKGTAFRFLTIAKEDFGICYGLTGNYFFFTTSFESTKKIIKEVEIKKLKEIGQLFIIGFEGKTITPQLESIFKKYQPGGVLLLSKNIEGKEQLKNLISELQNLSLKETGYPLLIAVDQEGEPMSRIRFLEEKTNQSKINTAEEAHQVGLKKGEELKELGINLNLAPVLDIMENDDFYFNRSFQKSATETGELAKSLILGQKKAGILTAIKHFPGYGGINFNSEEKLASVQNLPEISQFKKAMEAKPELVMAANMVYKEIDPILPFTFSQKSILFLKKNLGSEVLIISDDLAQNSSLNKFSLKEILTKPIGAGVDILIFSGWRFSVDKALETFSLAVKNKEISEAKTSEAVAKIIQLKQKMLK